MAKERAYRDPIHDFITVDDPLVQRLIDAPELQRLRRIRQLGLAAGTYHGAEHSRFGHALGAMWIMRQILRRFAENGVGIAPEEEEAALLAALLHDVGHGPFSHALEGVLTPGEMHEAWSRRIITGRTVLGDLLRQENVRLPERVADLLAGKSLGAPFLPGLVSGQLDVDRMDYLLRDSLYTGVTYGRFDLDRLVRTLVAAGDVAAIQAKGRPALEEYVLARHFMYWQVYLHKTIRGHELLLRTAWRRAAALVATGEGSPADGVPVAIAAALAGALTLAGYLELDDTDVWVALKRWRHHPDPVLSDLARRVFERDLFKAVYRGSHDAMPAEARLAHARAAVARAGLDPEYYLLVDHAQSVNYDPYTAPAGESDRAIWVQDEAGQTHELAALSPTMQALALNRRDAVNLYAPEAVIAEVRACLLSRL